MGNFKEVVASVLMFFGISAFSKVDGKSTLTDEQKKQLTEKFGEKFVNAFLAELAKAEESGETFDELVTAEMRLRLEAQQAEMDRLRAQAQELQQTNATLQATIKKLEGEPANDGGKAVTVSEFEAELKKNGVDLSMKHNRFLADYLQGKVSAAYSGDDTIDTQELKQEFGKYVDNNRMEIMKSLLGTTESTAYMTTIMTDKTEVRAQHAHITSVLQQFVPKWTPAGKSKFTPLVIKNYKCKINVSIIPSDIMEDILGYLYDEQAATLQSMPVVRYILYQLIFPKLNEERETALAVGKFKEVQPDGNGNYSASKPEETMEGYLTQLVKLYKADDTDITWLQKGTAITDENVLEVIDAAVQEVKPLYKKKKLTVHADPDLILKYQKAYRALYPWLKNEDGDNRVKIDFTNFTFAGLEGMRGTGCFFITPKENFKHLMSKNPQNITLRFQEVDYEVKIFGEWWEGTGFWLKEAIFAYINPSYANPEAAENGNANEGGENANEGGENANEGGENANEGGI
ncbi:MAG: hypothetical protein IKI18_04485 [Prevotella sp.]|nr:hypothetical protein [Prevotella sp.]